MKVDLVLHSPLDLIVTGALICTASEGKVNDYVVHMDELTAKGKDLLFSLIDKGHHSVLEHINYTFVIEGVSRSLLQELARHRHISLSVQSTRWALKKEEAGINTVVPGDFLNDDDTFSKEAIEALSKEQTDALESLLSAGVMHLSAVMAAAKVLPNDIVKYFLPEGITTKLMLTVNLRELRHIYQLRHAPVALKEFQRLMDRIYEALPATHKPLLLR